MISISLMTGTGEKKCRPMKRAGLSVAVASPVMEMLLVLVAKIASASALLELEAVAKRILAVEAPHTREVRVPGDLATRLLQALSQLVQVAHKEPRMRLPRGMKIVVNANVNLDPVETKPAAASIGEGLGFLDLREPQDADPEGARFRFAVGRRRPLHVVDHASRRRSAAVIGSSRCSAISATVESHCGCASALRREPSAMARSS